MGQGRLPRPLLWLLAAVLLLTLSWAFVMPPWQSPDEDDHFAYVQSLGDRLALPGDPDRPERSTEQRLALDRSGPESRTRALGTRIEWSETAHARWRHDDAMLPPAARRDGGGVSPAATNPPLYYAYAVIPYTLASAGGVFDRLYAVRALTVPWLLVTVAGAWLLAGEVFGPRRDLQLAAAAVTGLVPMTTFLAGSLNPDAAMFAAWAIALWLGARILRRGLTLGGGVAFFAAIGAGTLIKATTLVLIPAALLVLAVGVARLHRGGAGRRGALRAAGAALGALVVLAGGWAAASLALGRPGLFQVDPPEGAILPTSPVRLLVSYLWQFYLPKLPFQQEFTGFPDLPVYHFWVKQAWGVFGSLEVELVEPVYAALAVATAAVLAGAALALVRAWRGGRADRAMVVFFALVAASLLAGLHWTEYRLLVLGGLPFNQGRYLLPLLPLAGLAAAAALTLVRPRARGAVLTAGVAALLALQTLALGTVLAHFYG